MRPSSSSLRPGKPNRIARVVSKSALPAVEAAGRAYIGADQHADCGKRDRDHCESGQRLDQCETTTVMIFVELN